MRQNQSDGNSSGQEDHSHGGLLISIPGSSLPQEIDPEKLYVGLPTGWVDVYAVGDAQLIGIPDDHVLEIKTGRELMELK